MINTDILTHRHYKNVLNVVTSFPFYDTYVSLPDQNTPVPDFIRNNPKFFPYFEAVLGALDGTHLRCCPSAHQQGLQRDRKGQISMNCLAVCGWDFLFYHIIPGWDGSTSDSEMFIEARKATFAIPPGRCYLADAGFGICETLLVPYRGERYHLAEWGRADIR
jgi:hypothetical protein